MIEVGQLIRLSFKDKKLRVVIEAGEKVDYDNTRGDSYRVFQFKTVVVPFSKERKVLAGVLPSTKVESFWLAGGSMSGDGVQVNGADLVYVGRVDKVSSTTTYKIGRVRLDGVK